MTMAAYYLDTSALVKRYARERGTAWVTTLTTPSLAHDLYTVRLAGPETIAALFRKVRTGELPRATALRLAQDFKEDWKWQYQVLEINAKLSDRAMTLAEKHGLRGYDAVHLAAALLLHETRRAAHLLDMIFLAADDDLLQAAKTEGLSTDNPDHYA
ncbi:MAG: type II toxin-antitoxin system VapC family toxin [Anaerolineae bacterium]